MNTLSLAFFLTMILMLSIVSSTFSRVEAYDVNYEILTNRIPANPTVCVIKAYDYQFPEYRMKMLMDETKTAVMEWITQLRQKEHKDTLHVWDIKYVVKNSILDGTSECNIVIDFQRKPDDSELEFKRIGVHWYDPQKQQSFIIIYYLQIILCKTSDQYFIYYNPCYADDIRMSAQIGTTVRHEFGHAIGLGHIIKQMILK